MTLDPWAVVNSHCFKPLNLGMICEISIANRCTPTSSVCKGIKWGTMPAVIQTTYTTSSIRQVVPLKLYVQSTEQAFPQVNFGDSRTISHSWAGSFEER